MCENTNIFENNTIIYHVNMFVIFTENIEGMSNFCQLIYELTNV